MLFHKLRMNYFGRFHNKEIDLQPGINLIYGENEAGKSTLHTFIKGMLFGIERLRGRGSASKEDLYTRYLPWDYPGAFGGSMEVMIGDRKYRLTRSFHANDKSFTVTDLTTGRDVNLKEGNLGELLPGMTETAFRNTVSIEQLKAHTDAELATQVRNYIANLSVAKSQEVNVAKAVSSLTELKKQLDPAQKLVTLKSLKESIDDALANEEKMDQLSTQLKEMLEQEQELERQKEQLDASQDKEVQKRMEQLPAILEKYRSYQELTRQAALQEAQSEEIKVKLDTLEKSIGDLQGIKEDRSAAEELQRKLMELDKQASELQKEKEGLKGSGKKTFAISILPSVILAVILALITGGKVYGLLLAALLVVLGAAGYFLLNNKTRKAWRGLAAREEAFHEKTAALQEELGTIFRKYQVQDIRALGEKQEAFLKNAYDLEYGKQQQEEMEQRKSDLLDSRDAVYEAIMKYVQYFLPAEELTSQTMQLLQEDIRLRRQKTSDRLALLDQQISIGNRKIDRLRWEISTLEGNEERLMKAQQRYQELQQTLNENTVELEAVKLALSSIQELSTEIHDSFGQELNRAVSEVISVVTGQKYQDLKIDEKLEVKVGLNGEYVLLERLSAGTIDQVYFALRMAVADLLLGKDEVPLLLDDSFALYDDQRVKAALAEIAGRKQTLLFTCHKREQKLLEELGLPYHIVEL